MMPKYMFVTVGTSLFNSASWRSDAMDADILGSLDLARAYNNWCAHYLGSPSKRARDYLLSNKIGEILKCAPNETPLTRNLATENPHIHYKRYSAEISTIIKYATRVEEGDDWQGFLREFQILLITDTNDYSGTEQATMKQISEHLSEQLRILAGNVSCELLPCPGLSANQPRALKTNLINILKTVYKISTNDAESVFITSGGYKILGNYLFSLINYSNIDNAECVYMHEDSEHLIRCKRNEVWINDEMGHPDPC